VHWHKAEEQINRISQINQTNHRAKDLGEWRDAILAEILVCEDLE
jgi:hypothetical protein